jgi:hypothetical protein
MNRLALIALVFAWLAACSGGAGGDPQSTSTAPATVVPEKVDFTAFTEALVSSRPDSTDPVPVTAAEFTFRDDDNAAAFSTVLTGT